VGIASAYQPMQRDRRARCTLLRISVILLAPIVGAACSRAHALNVAIEGVRMERGRTGRTYDSGAPTQWRTVDVCIIEIALSGRSVQDLEGDTVGGSLFVEGKVSGCIAADWDRLGSNRFKLSFEIANSVDTEGAPERQLDYGEGTRLWLEVGCLRRATGQTEWTEVAVSGRLDVSQLRPIIEQHLAKYRIR